MQKERYFPKEFPTGLALLHDRDLNKGTAFTEEERDAFGLRGLLPPHVHTQQEQAMRVLENFHNKPSDLEKYIHMMALQERNKTLFYRVVMDNIEEMMPIVYTPTVGQACIQYGHIYQRSRGLCISANDRGRMGDILRNWPYEDIRLIVVTDGERILGLGDLGACGMGIPVGKLILYTACAGIHPSLSLPITLDVGTGNESLLNDSLYIGLKQQRLTGKEYNDFIEEFILAVQERYPQALIQLEDFGHANAFGLLSKYRDRVCLFDDDIQGTGAAILAGIYSALRIMDKPITDEKFLVLGAGQAGIGTADIIVSALIEEGFSVEEARQRCWLVDSQGLVVKGRANLNEQKMPYAHEHEFCQDLLSAVESIRPQVIIGASGQPGKFTRKVLEAMAAFNERPVIFPLSNPTSKAECTAEDAYKWTEGRAIFASGSPFGPVTYKGETYLSSQANNACIFPGLGLGVIACGASRVTNEMFFAAAKVLAHEVSASDLKQGLLYPPLTRVREVSLAIGMAVAEVAYGNGLAGKPKPEDLEAYIKSQVYEPNYVSYI
ncbi:MAG: NAD-dependent malic enzyme [Dehalococcoidia bacterium]